MLLEIFNSKFYSKMTSMLFFSSSIITLSCIIYENIRNNSSLACTISILNYHTGKKAARPLREPLIVALIVALLMENDSEWTYHGTW